MVDQAIRQTTNNNKKKCTYCKWHWHYLSKIVNDIFSVFTTEWMNIDHIFDYSCIFADYIWTKYEHFIINNLSSLIKSNRKNLLILFLFRRLYNHWLEWDFIFHRRHKYIKARLICCLVCCRLDHLHILLTDRLRIFLFLFKFFMVKVLFHFFMTSSKFHWKNTSTNGVIQVN